MIPVSTAIKASIDYVVPSAIAPYAEPIDNEPRIAWLAHRLVPRSWPRPFVTIPPLPAWRNASLIGKERYAGTITIRVHGTTAEQVEAMLGAIGQALIGSVSVTVNGSTYTVRYQPQLSEIATAPQSQSVEIGGVFRYTIEQGV